MGIHEETKACKLEKPSSPPSEPEQQQTSIHVYPDWAAMQAYYGPRMAAPPYFNPAVASGHGPPPYMWGPPQHLMPPYAAFYPHGGVYAHPGVTIGASPLNIDSPAKSSGNSDRSLMKKNKGLDGLAMSIGNNNGDGAEGGNDNGVSHSGETNSSEGSDGNTAEGGQNGRKRNREGSPILSEGPVLSPNPITELSLKNSPSTANMTTTTFTLLPNESLPQNDQELKKERRKQSNRESARRSRLRKQVETEELAVQVETLNSENSTLRSEISRLTDDSEKLKRQNVELMEKLKIAQKGVTEDPMHLSTANLLSRVNNGSGEEVYDNNKKLHQLLDSSPRTDAVAAT